MSTPREILDGPMADAAKLLNTTPFTPDVCVLLLAIGLQESKLVYRRQIGNGPARGIFQFEKGTASSRGGVTGLMLHQGSVALMKAVCVARKVPWDATAIWSALETDDVLACCVARIMLWTDPKKIPSREDEQAGWNCYARIWRPGKPRPDHWAANHAAALEAVIHAEG